MCNIFDFDDGDFIIKTSDNRGRDMDGNTMIRMEDNMAIDMESGEIHIVFGWYNDEEDD